ncbi:hypothetical protein COO91_10800 (plasmid) [Nostoc flagelliforme CCNUN1]|uniref:Uncharacterized protein n=1 Tax=Nostoc flagelliforme CCNUN1 TaxID=2038116 RepID=A0A2K8TA38_9NOSO|nr:hypothetical protein [Nostoc flagelliforme]AUB44564.1 hypothetical protein COO91_10800 [Nostoc flagelliforme CCNUN1]
MKTITALTLSLILLPLPTRADSVTVGVVFGNRQLSYDSSHSITTVDGLTKFHYIVGSDQHSAVTPYCYQGSVQLNPHKNTAEVARLIESPGWFELNTDSRITSWILVNDPESPNNSPATGNLLTAIYSLAK